MVQIKYERQSRIPAWDQKKLAKATIAVIGAGALGNHVCAGLIGLGLGTIKIYDFDNIEAHNLNRQSLFLEEDIGKNKAEILAERLQERNSSIIIVGINQKIEEETVDAILQGVDVLIDCVDLIYVRRILNRFALMEDIPMVHGGISWVGGQAGILTRETPCINCIYPQKMQEEEMNLETSCIRKPEPSVVYISQIIAGLMVFNVRRILMPLPSDPARSQGLYKIDFRFHPPFYFENISRKKNCECSNILKMVAPEILEKEKKEESLIFNRSNQELKNFLQEDNNF